MLPLAKTSPLALRAGASLLGVLPAVLLTAVLADTRLGAQCPAAAAGLATELHCVEHNLPSAPGEELDPTHAYTLSELIDLAESSHPATRMAWLEARAAAERVGLARSEYLPHLAGMATFLNQKFINPFPKPYAPQGYTMVEMPVAEAGLGVGYTLLDFGRRHAKLESARAGALAEAAHFQRENQTVAFGVITAYYHLTDAEQKLAARQQILQTAQTIQSAAEAQLANGRATLPDVLDARAGTARADFELEQAVGEEQSARVALRESVGVRPSDQIRIAPVAEAGTGAGQVATAGQLVDEALKTRPDLAGLTERIHAAEAVTAGSRSAYLPTVEFSAKGASQSIWPTVSTDYGWLLTNTTQFVWQAGVSVRWDLFDGGARRSELATARDEQRKAEQQRREAADAITRATWTAWVDYRTAERREKAAAALFTAADSSYKASLEAYNYGVKNLIDLVHAEQQLAEARLATVEARSALETATANLGYTTGNLLRTPAAAGTEADRH